MIGRARLACGACTRSYMQQFRWPVPGAPTSNPARHSSTAVTNWSTISPDVPRDAFPVDPKHTRSIPWQNYASAGPRRSLLKAYAPYMFGIEKERGTDFHRQKKGFWAWIRDFAKMFRQFGPQGQGLVDPIPAEKLQRESLIKLLKRSSVEEMRETWLEKSEIERELDWPKVMLGALRFAPDRAAEVLEATVERGISPIWAVTDTIAFLVIRAARLPEDRRKEQQAVLPRLLLQALRADRRTFFPQWVLFHIIDLSDARTLAEIHSELQQSNQNLHYQTLLHIGGRLANDIRYKLTAVRILERLVDRGHLDQNSPHCAALATAIASFPKLDGGGGEPGFPIQSLPRIQAEVYERLVRFGITPNVITYTAMIQGLCATRRLTTAWKFYDVMCDEGHTPDPHVYSALLYGSKIAGDFKSIRRVLTEASPEALQQTPVWNDILDSILELAIREAKHRRIQAPRVIPAFPAMLRIYVKFFKLEPLQKLIPSDILRYLAADDQEGHWEWKAEAAALARELPESPVEDLVEPRGDTLGIMLLAYLRSSPNLYNLIVFYSHFRTLVKRRDPIATDLLHANTLIYDAVMKTVTEHDGTLRLAVDILNDMLNDAAAFVSAYPTNAVSVTEFTPPPHSPPHWGMKPSPPPSPPTTTPTVTTTTALTTITTINTTATTISSTPLPPYHPPPSVHTWSILLHALLNKRYHRQGEQILSMMRQHGIEPNLVTWNTLISGYARAQRVVPTVSSIVRLEEAGYQADDYTIRAFRHLANRERALQMLEQRIARREAAGGDGKVEVGRFMARVEKERRMLEEIERAEEYDEDGEGVGGPEGEGEGEVVESGVGPGHPRNAADPAKEFMRMRDEMEGIGDGLTGA